MANLKIIKELCSERNITLSDLANKTGLGLRGLQKIIKENSTKIETLERISEALNVKPSLFFNDPPNPDDQLKQIEKALMGTPMEAMALVPVFQLIIEKKECNDRIRDLELIIEVQDKIFSWLVAKKHFPSLTSFQSVDEHIEFLDLVLEIMEGEGSSLIEANPDLSSEIIRSFLFKYVETGEDSELLTWLHSRNNDQRERRYRKVLKIPIVQELLLQGKIPDSILREYWDKYHSKDGE